MSKTVLIVDSVVKEIIPDYALPVEKWYGEEFASNCVEAPDDVVEGLVYDPITKTFSEPIVPTPTPNPPTNEELAKEYAALSEQLAQSDEAAITLFEAKVNQESINAQQDEAILQIYEKIGG